MALKKTRLPFRYLEPAFFGGLLDDPLLFLRIRPLRRALLFDCGQITHLSKRVVKAIDTVFITHAHMDLVMGIPTLVRHHHASPRPLDIYGPPGIAERVEHQLMGYDWNLNEPTWFTLFIKENHSTIYPRQSHWDNNNGWNYTISRQHHWIPDLPNNHLIVGRPGRYRKVYDKHYSTAVVFPRMWFDGQYQL